MDDLCSSTKSYGYSGTTQWKPFSYQKRVADVAKLKEKKQDLTNSKSSLVMKCQNLTSYISRTLFIRQEEIPLITEYIDRVKAEPLQLKNNVVKEKFVNLLEVCTSLSTFKNLKSYREIPSSTL